MALANANATPTGSPAKRTWVSRKTPSDRDRRGGDVAPDTGADQGQDDRADELDRRHRRERQVVDREVEARVHRREHRAEADDQRAAPAIEREQLPPRPAPDREDQRGRGDPQPGDAEHVDPGEQQHGERRPQVVEDRAAREVQPRRQLAGAHAHAVQGGGRRRRRGSPHCVRCDGQPLRIEGVTS